MAGWAETKCNIDTWLNNQYIMFTNVLCLKAMKVVNRTLLNVCVTDRKHYDSSALSYYELWRRCWNRTVTEMIALNWI